MRESISGAGPSPPRLPNANRRWKDRWGAHIRLSTLAAAALHALLLALWPVWQITRIASPERSEFVQLHPIVTPGAPIGTGEVPAAPSPDREEAVEPAAEAGGPGIDDADLGDLVEIFGAARAEVANPVLGNSIVGRPAAPLTAEELLLEQLTARSPQLAAGVSMVHWPVIRNPTTLVSYLRRAYNSIERDQGARGFVSVAMWVDQRGAVEWAEVRRSSGHPVLDEIALVAFNRIAIFSPARSTEMRVPVMLEISVPFTVPW